MKAKFMGVAAALTAALALVFGVAVSGALPNLPVATAPAQETTALVSPEKHDFTQLKVTGSVSVVLKGTTSITSEPVEGGRPPIWN
ncbi:hypothetical protein ACL1B8_10210 [Corynebacterium striatum]|uniref:hypothetical protein n=1 Tax=Corynebacterium striatum TaxID=43770 RepID=UPI001EF6867A|nr:hypothetical protein [Corynebacterium striatum]MCG7249835.1 hypothetical protein [Corynebacterium striatum]